MKSLFCCRYSVLLFDSITGVARMLWFWYYDLGCNDVLNIDQWSYDPTSGAVWKYVCIEMYMHALIVSLLYTTKQQPVLVLIFNGLNATQRLILAPSVATLCIAWMHINVHACTYTEWHQGLYHSWKSQPPMFRLSQTFTINVDVAQLACIS